MDLMVLLKQIPEMLDIAAAVAFLHLEERIHRDQDVIIAIVLTILQCRLQMSRMFCREIWAADSSACMSFCKV